MNWPLKKEAKAIEEKPQFVQKKARKSDENKQPTLCGKFMICLIFLCFLLSALFWATARKLFSDFLYFSKVFSSLREVIARSSGAGSEKFLQN